jgi:hypothetical protein
MRNQIKSNDLSFISRINFLFAEIINNKSILYFFNILLKKVKIFN